MHLLQLLAGQRWAGSHFSPDPAPGKSQAGGDGSSSATEVGFAVAEIAVSAAPEPATFLSSPKAPCGAGHIQTTTERSVQTNVTAAACSWRGPITVMVSVDLIPSVFP